MPTVSNVLKMQNGFKCITIMFKMLNVYGDINLVGSGA